MKILTTGCSFTHSSDSWANYLKKQYDLVNIAQGGSGNEFNFRNAGLELMQNDYDIAIFQLSGINRFELILADENYEALSFIPDKSNHAHIFKKDTYCWRTNLPILYHRPPKRKRPERREFRPLN